MAISLRTMRAVTSDGDLIQRAATGDRSAFEDLYNRYSRAVFGLALRRLGDRGRAEDAVQETFASIWRSAGTYRPERGPGAPCARAAAPGRPAARSSPCPLGAAHRETRGGGGHRVPTPAEATSRCDA